MKTEQRGAARQAGAALTRRGFCLAAGAAVWPGSARPANDPGERPVPLALSESVSPQFTRPLLTLIGQASGLNWDRKPVPFSRLLMMAEQGLAIGFGISPVAAREPRLLFSREVFSGAVWAISRRERPVEVRKLADLRDLRVCMSRSANYGPELEASKGRLFEAQYAAGDLVQRLRTLQAGRCDVLLATSHNAATTTMRAHVIAAGGDPQSFIVSERPLVEQGVHFAVARDSELAAVMPRIDAAIQARKAQIRHLVAQAD